MTSASILSIIILLAGAAASAPAGEKPPPKPGKKVPYRLSKRPRDAWRRNLKILNGWGKQPEAVQRLYTAAGKVLAGAYPDYLKASFADVAANAEYRKACAESGVLHLGGPMLGCVGPEGASVWMRTAQPAKVEVQVGGKSYGPVASTVETGLTAIVPVTGLKPATSYPYRVLVDGKPVPLPKGARITTTPGEKDPAKVRIAFGSCFHQRGLGNNKQAESIRARKPAAMLLLGDIAVQDRNHLLGLHRADYLMRDFFPAWRKLVSSVPVYATWDDHDYFDNDISGLPPGNTRADRSGVRTVFRNSWNNPQYGFGDERGGVFLRTRIGPCDVIMTDNRYFRTRKKPKSFLGEEQMKWLEKQLLDCKGPFIIVSCGTMWSDYVSNGKDSWGSCDKPGRERIFNLIEKKRISGVLLISGDRHGARGFRIPRPSGFNFYEFEAASLGGRGRPDIKKPEWKTQFYGINKYAFGEFSIDATLKDPEVTFRLIGDDSKVLHELKLKRSQLTPSGK